SQFRGLLRKECADLRRKRCDSLSWEPEKQRELYREMWAETANPARLAFIRAALSDIDPTKSSENMSMASVLRQVRLEISNLILVAAKDKGDMIVEEPEFPASQLLSDIGGLMGLYLGVSVIGLCEFLAVLVLLGKTATVSCCPPR
uniref:Transmembrane protein 65 n=1 Tax=Macrostomum lignano TaxID=282301 RepID=A0A1I8FXB0_9PLAT